MHTIKFLLLATLGAAALAGGTSTALGGRDFAEKSYQEGLELMSDGRYDQAADRFEYAVKSAKMNKRTPKPKYFVKWCEASTRIIGIYRDDQWGALVAICDKAVARTGGAERERAVKLRATMGRALGTKAAKQGKSALDAADHGRAQKWYQLATRYDPRPAYFGALCESYSATGSKKAAAVCARAASGLKGAAKERATKRARQASERPTAAQQAAITGLEAVVGKVTDTGRTEPARQCLERIEKARRAGVKAHHRVVVNYEFPGAKTIANPGRTPDYVTTFDRVEAVCQEVFVFSIVTPLARVLESSQRQLDGGGHVSIAGARQCREAVKAALDAGLDAGTVITYARHTVEARRADEVVCLVLEKRAVAREAELRAREAELEAKEKAERAAKLAPFKKVLRGDKWKLYEKYGYFDGRGGNQLSTPRQLARAKKWFGTAMWRDPETRLPAWRVTTYIFRGHKLVRTVVKTGWSPAPPSSAYR